MYYNDGSWRGDDEQDGGEEGDDDDYEDEREDEDDDEDEDANWCMPMWWLQFQIWVS